MKTKHLKFQVENLETHNKTNQDILDKQKTELYSINKQDLFYNPILKEDYSLTSFRADTYPVNTSGDLSAYTLTKIVQTNKILLARLKNLGCLGSVTKYLSLLSLTTQFILFLIIFITHASACESFPLSFATDNNCGNNNCNFTQYALVTGKAYSGSTTCLSSISKNPSDPKINITIDFSTIFVSYNLNNCYHSSDLLFDERSNCNCAGGTHSGEDPCLSVSNPSFTDKVITIPSIDSTSDCFLSYTSPVCTKIGYSLLPEYRICELSSPVYDITAVINYNNCSFIHNFITSPSFAKGCGLNLTLSFSLHGDKLNTVIDKVHVTNVPKGVSNIYSSNYVNKKNELNTAKSFFWQIETSPESYLPFIRVVSKSCLDDRVSVFLPSPVLLPSTSVISDLQIPVLLKGTFFRISSGAPGWVGNDDKGPILGPSIMLVNFAKNYTLASIKVGSNTPLTLTTYFDVFVCLATTTELTFTYNNAPLTTVVLCYFTSLNQTGFFLYDFATLTPRFAISLLTNVFVDYNDGITGNRVSASFVNFVSVTPTITPGPYDNTVVELAEGSFEASVQVNNIQLTLKQDNLVPIIDSIKLLNTTPLSIDLISHCRSGFGVCTLITQPALLVNREIKLTTDKLLTTVAIESDLVGNITYYFTIDCGSFKDTKSVKVYLGDNIKLNGTTFVQHNINQDTNNKNWFLNWISNLSVFQIAAASSTLATVALVIVAIILIRL